MNDYTKCKRCNGDCTCFTNTKGDIIWECSQCGDQVKFVMPDNTRDADVIRAAKHLHNNAPTMIEFPSGDRDYLD